MEATTTQRESTRHRDDHFMRGVSSSKSGEGAGDKDRVHTVETVRVEDRGVVREVRKTSMATCDGRHQTVNSDGTVGTLLLTRPGPAQPNISTP